MDWIVATARLGPKAKILDVGCGTGLSTRLFAERGYDVLGIDPNPEMLAYAEASGFGRYRLGDAEKTGVPDGWADLVTAAQAMHWFDLPAVLPELQRILKPGGWCAAFWNRRADTPFLKEYDGLLKEHSSDYGRIRSVAETLKLVRQSPGVKSWQEASFPHRQVLDRAGLHGRVWSSSYVVHGVEEREAFDKQLNELFDRHADRGKVEFLYHTDAAAWQF